MSKPAFSLKLVKNNNRQMLETTPRYDVVLNGAAVGELYFNTRGYVGYLPTVQGSKMDIGERGISAFRKEVAILNREAEAVITASLADPAKVARVLPTEDRRVLAAMVVRFGSELEDDWSLAYISRKEFLKAQELFGKDVMPGRSFFTEHPGGPEAPAVILGDANDSFSRMFPNAPQHVVDPKMFEAWTRTVDLAVDAQAKDTKIIITRDAETWENPEISHVSAFSLAMARANYGEALRLADIVGSVVSPPASPEDREKIRAILPNDDPWGYDRAMAFENPELVERYVDQVIETDVPSTLFIVSRRVVDDADPEPHWISAASYHNAVVDLGDMVRISHLMPAPRVPVSDLGARSAIIGAFTWMHDQLDGLTQDEFAAEAQDIERKLGQAKTHGQPSSDTLANSI